MLLPNQKWMSFDITIKLFDHDKNSFILLERKDYVTHLEILIDSISLGNNILKTCKSLGILSRFRHFVATDTLLRIYGSLILPYITYGIALWSQVAQTNLDKLPILQKVLFVKFPLLHTDLMRSRYTTSIIYSCRTFNTASQFALLSMTFLRIHCRETFPTIFFHLTQEHSYDTRFSETGSLINKYSTTHQLKHLFSLDARIWNSIPQKYPSTH